jgi:hypothetical protein
VEFFYSFTDMVHVAMPEVEAGYSLLQTGTQISFAEFFVLVVKLISRWEFWRCCSRS